MLNTEAEDHEHSAGGDDFENPLREHAETLGASMAEKGPEVLFEELEELLPESWREHIKGYPIAAILIGFGVGIFLGMKKGDEIIDAGSSMIGAVAMSNLAEVMERLKGE
ncbi:MAG TPA: hypothetical protein VEZ11_01265 [Thermoanaerobaculia bacterium]|nr:hypothetical protein [Thermoanaerobaculia bacterium]